MSKFRHSLMVGSILVLFSFISLIYVIFFAAEAGKEIISALVLFSGLVGVAGIDIITSEIKDKKS